MPASVPASCTKASAPTSADRTSIWSSSAKTPKTCTPASNSRRASRRPPAHRPDQRSATGKKIGTGVNDDRRQHQADLLRRHATRSRTTRSITPCKHGRKSVTSVCKANIMKFTDGLWYDETRAVAAGLRSQIRMARSGRRCQTRSGARRQGEADERPGCLRRAAHRQHVHAARAEARSLRRDRHCRTCTATS